MPCIWRGSKWLERTPLPTQSVSKVAVCILSMCSSYGAYGSRDLRFILDRARINVAISRAKCLAIVVGDPRIETRLLARLEK
jgi:hypothetical protein